MPEVCSGVIGILGCVAGPENLAETNNFQVIKFIHNIQVTWSPKKLTQAKKW